jgi:hypothetical protein
MYLRGSCHQRYGDGVRRARRAIQKGVTLCRTADSFSEPGSEAKSLLNGQGQAFYLREFRRKPREGHACCLERAEAFDLPRSCRFEALHSGFFIPQGRLETEQFPGYFHSPVTKPLIRIDTNVEWKLNTLPTNQNLQGLPHSVFRMS